MPSAPVLHGPHGVRTFLVMMRSLGLLKDSPAFLNWLLHELLRQFVTRCRKRL